MNKYMVPFNRPVHLLYMHIYLYYVKLYIGGNFIYYITRKMEVYLYKLVL